MEKLIRGQQELFDQLIKAERNLKKANQETRAKYSYLVARMEALEKLEEAFSQNHLEIIKQATVEQSKELKYFKDDMQDMFQELFIQYKATLKEYIVLATQHTATMDTRENSLATSKLNNSEVHLPRIQLPHFSGKYTEWQSFYDMFLSLIHENNTLSPVQKLHYLKSSLSGEPEMLLRNFPTTSANYKEAWEQLSKRYNNKKYNCNAIMKTLFGQKLIQHESTNALKHLLDTTTSCLKALNNLNISTDQWDPVIIHLVVSKLDNESLRQWETYVSSASDELPKWSQLEQFIETRFRTLELLETGAQKSKNMIQSKSSHQPVKAKSFHSALEVREDELLKKFWEIENEPNSIEKRLTEEEKLCEKLYEETTLRRKDGRFVVRLPFKTIDPQCQYGQSYDIAINKLLSLEKRLSKNPTLSNEYHRVLEEYTTLNHMKQTLAVLEKDKFPVAAHITKNDYYVDDLMTGCETETEALQIYEEMTELMNTGGFELQKWSSSNQRFVNYIEQNKVSTVKSLTIESDGMMKVLGIKWNRLTDNFEYVVNLINTKEPITKRTILSEIARLYDPIGWISPVVITAKIFIQKLWKERLEWDDELPKKLLLEWLHYKDELRNIKNILIPRWLCCTKKCKLELHAFSDASHMAYAAVVYLRVIDEHNKVYVNLVTAKTKVAPIEKEVSIPRLELCGATLAAKLLHEVSQVMKIPKSDMFAWTDSTVVLAWLRGPVNRWVTKKPELEVGDVVIVKDDNIPPAKWLLGKVIEKHHGPDNVTRVVTLKCKRGLLKRPISKLCILTKPT
ncbi:unnamed protein product [Euphydryas editha]|uniref:DUF5641 domain-containing protein n=1 Tax=Euphydryas editha TaxID=104508 RepID=A0AAU9UZ59_EUPED|nr:unnamed protein product [Euphydryas editha]